MQTLLEEKEKAIKSLIAQHHISSPAVEKALRKVPREEFIPGKDKKYAYVDTPLPIGSGQTISAMHMVAIMTSLLDLKKGSKILEIGTGTGYQAAVMAEITGEKGKIFTIETIPELAERAKRNLKKCKCANVSVVTADGSEGYEKEAPYDRILVTCGAPKIPKPLTGQLKNNGKLIIPVGSQFTQELLVVTKKNSQLKKESHGYCRFVLLVGKHGWK